MARRIEAGQADAFGQAASGNALRLFGAGLREDRKFYVRLESVTAMQSGESEQKCTRYLQEIF